MSETKSTVRQRAKPINVFYVWYTELCRRLNSTPVPVVKPAKPKSQTILDFVGDRLKFDEWTPIINALRHDTSLHIINIRSRLGNCQFLHDVDTEEKAKRLKKKSGSLWTTYIIKSLLKSLSYSLRNTQVLTCLELDGLPVFNQYLEPLLEAVKKNKSLKTLSFTNSIINDIGCQMVCAYLRFTPNIEILNLSGCGLTAESGIYISKLIKFQQINRYCESWHNSLRYEDPEAVRMRGLKRLTLNSNRNFGDEGLDLILNELEDDLWIKAVDLQKCGITENLVVKIFNVIEKNRSLEIFDLRQNDYVSLTTIDNILHILEKRMENVVEPEFQWCNTAVSLTFQSITSNSKLSHASTNGLTACATKSLTLRNSTVKNSLTWDKMRKPTTTSIQKSIPLKNETKVEQLTNKLQEEIKRRKEIEKRNEELQNRLNSINQQKQLSKTTISSNLIKFASMSPRVPADHLYNGTKNGCKPKSLMKLNGYHKPNKNGLTSNACKIFQQLMLKGNVINDSDDNNIELINDNTTNGLVKNKNEFLSDSQTSLCKFIEELKSKNGFHKNHRTQQHCTVDKQ